MSQLSLKAHAVPDGGMRRFEIDDHKVLIVRDGDDLRAFDAVCPHAGADLSQGARCAARVVCPWHHGSFDLHDGHLLEPPADVGLTRYTVSRDGETYTVHVDKPLTAPAPTPRGADRRTVIVGAGAGGYMAVQALRAGGYAGHIDLIDPQDAAPYDRTMLSKQFLAGKAEAADVVLGDDSWAKQQSVTRHRRRAEAIELTAKQVRLDDGSNLPYTALIIATGSAPVAAKLPGADLGGVHLLRSLNDAKALRAAAQGRKLVIVGGNFIALEAACLVGEGGAASVDVVVREGEILSRIVSARIGRELRRVHEARGVHIHLDTGVAAIEGDGVVTAVRLSDGRALPAELVLLGTGAAPQTSLLASFADADGALKVDAHMRLAPDLYAIGDIATAPSVLGPKRIEHWRVAQQQAIVAAQSILGDVAQPMDRRVPFFWTLQQDKNLRYVGHADSTDDSHIWGDPEALDFIEFSFSQGHAVAASGLQHDDQLAAFEELLRLGCRLSAQAIRAGQFDLSERLHAYRSEHAD